MKLVWSPHAWDDYLHWQANEADVLKRVNELIEECPRDPFKGTGKPEPLKGDLEGWWCRRITRADRLVYWVQGAGETQALGIAQCRSHY